MERGHVSASVRRTLITFGQKACSRLALRRTECPRSATGRPIITDHVRTVTMTAPIANYDNNRHADNEYVRLQNPWDWIETMAAIMTMKPKF
ncbi:MAG: hypothetical protein QOH70_2749 [Blastocatellia bacterium]|jgi:hypothetical protein|nr:hypothetical protein [Blastocatellia bacterium]